MNSRKLACFLAVLFFIGMVFATLYSTSYEMRNRPFVTLVAPEHRDLALIFDFYGVVESAGDEQRERGFEWITIVTHYEEPYLNAMITRIPLRVGSYVYVYPIGSSVAVRAEVVHAYGIQGNIQYVVGFSSSNIESGDTVRVYRETHSFNQPLIPASAIHFDPMINSHFAYVVDRQAGAWGREFIVRREGVFISGLGRRGDYYVANLIGSSGPIVSWSDGLIFDGVRVRLTE